MVRSKFFIYAVEVFAAERVNMARVVEAAGPDHGVVVVHVGPEGGFDLAGALHPEVLPLAQAHGLPVIGSLLFLSRAGHPLLRVAIVLTNTRYGAGVWASDTQW
jgi:hypothetical protein